MNKHTPGPWRYCPTNNGHMIAGGKPGYLAEIRDCGSGDVKANAKLIAAAPDLLALATRCKEYLKHPDGHHLPASEWFDLNDALSAAIAKAQG